MLILVTGSSGFIGFHLSKKLLEQNHNIIGIDNMNNYYDVNLKQSRLDILNTYKNFTFYKESISNKTNLDSILNKYKFDIVINLAAQAGVRYSITNPDIYIESNIIGFTNILEYCRYTNTRLIYASSSSVYGNQKKVPFEETDIVDSPISLYAATKKSNELMAYTYNHLYRIKTIGLRFFTVYGEYGRPDMSPMLFADSITQNKPIHVFNNGNMFRDFTYIEDIVNGIIELISHDEIYCDVFNIGRGEPVYLLDFIKKIETQLGKESEKIFLPMQDGDVYQTYSSTKKLQSITGYNPKISIDDGIKRFIDWYNSYYLNK